MSRLKSIPVEEMTAEQRQVYDEGVAMGRRMSSGPFVSYMRNPGYLALHIRAMANLFKPEPLPIRQRQIVVLTTIRHWESDFPWQGQAAWNEEAGLEAEIVDAIWDGQEPPFERADDKAAYAFCKSLLDHRKVDDATYAECVGVLGEDMLSTIVIAMGMITTTSLTCNAFGISYS